MKHNELIDYSKLVPDLSDWNHGDGISIDDWLYHRGSFELAIAFSRLFWPSFVEYDGCVFFDDFSEESYRGWMGQCKADRAAVENVMNHQDLHNLFGAAMSDPATADQILYLGSLLKDAWQTKLANDFPRRQFEVSFYHVPSDLQAEQVVTFCQPSNRLGG